MMQRFLHNKINIAISTFKLFLRPVFQINFIFVKAIYETQKKEDLPADSHFFPVPCIDLGTPTTLLTGLYIVSVACLYHI